MVVAHNKLVSAITIVSILSAPVHVLAAEDDIEEIVVWGSDLDQRFGNPSPGGCILQF